MAGSQKESTKRAALLLRALDCINANDYDDQGDHIIFGKELIDIMDEAGVREDEIARDPDRVPVREFVSDVKMQSGRDRSPVLTHALQPHRGIRCE